MLISFNGLALAAGDCQVVSANIHGGLVHNLDALMEQTFDVLAIQEAETDERDVLVLQARAKRARFFFEFGESTALQTKKGSRIGRRVALLSRHPLIASAEDFHGKDEVVSFLAASGRWLERTIMLDGGSTSMHVACLYGISGSSQHGSRRDQTHVLHASAFARMHALATSPYLLCTDSNLNPAELPAAEHAKSLGIAHEVFDEGFQGAPPPTFAEEV